MFQSSTTASRYQLSQRSLPLPHNLLARIAFSTPATSPNAQATSLRITSRLYAVTKISCARCLLLATIPRAIPSAFRAASPSQRVHAPAEPLSTHMLSRRPHRQGPRRRDRFYKRSSLPHVDCMRKEETTETSWVDNMQVPDGADCSNTMLNCPGRQRRHHALGVMNHIASSGVPDIHAAEAQLRRTVWSDNEHRNRRDGNAGSISTTPITRVLN